MVEVNFGESLKSVTLPWVAAILFWREGVRYSACVQSCTIVYSRYLAYWQMNVILFKINDHQLQTAILAVVIAANSESVLQ